jgi:hypothetical protein
MLPLRFVLTRNRRWSIPARLSLRQMKRRWQMPKSPEGSFGPNEQVFVKVRLRGCRRFVDISEAGKPHAGLTE